MLTNSNNILGGREGGGEEDNGRSRIGAINCANINFELNIEKRGKYGIEKWMEGESYRIR